ncbi:MAG: FKBP-type peptidyl-prolyl cis-trans isomerase [Myxococcota bacterium]
MILLACARPSTTPPPRAAAAAPVEKPFFQGPPPGAAYTDSGIAYVVLQPGSGTEHPTALDSVTVNYSGWTADGTMFDSSAKTGQPATFPLDRVIPGWTEGVQLMVVGEKTRFWIPAQLAYGYRGGGPIGQLTFDIELLAINGGS